MLNLYFNTATSRLIPRPGTAGIVSEISLKRGDLLPLQITLVEDGDTGVLATDFAADLAQVWFGIKSQIDGELLVFAAFTPTADQAIWETEVGTNTAELNAAIAGKTAILDAVAEVTLQTPRGWVSSQTVRGVIYNDVLDDDETAPTVDPAAAAFEAAIAAVVTAETQDLATQDALAMERDARILADTNEANARVQSLNAEASVRAAAITAEAQARIAGDADALSKNNGGTVMGATTFAGRLQATQPPTQPTDAARLIDIQTATLPRITFDVICPAGDGVDRINDYYFTSAQLAALGIVSGVNSYVLVEVIAVTPYVGTLKRHTQISKYSEGGMACDPNPAVQTAGVTDGNISAFYDFVVCSQTGFTAPENDSQTASRVKVSIRNKVRDNNPTWPLKIRFTKIA